MLSFNNDPKIKERALKQLEIYYKAKDIVNLSKWEDNFVGCEECTDGDEELSKISNMYNNYKNLKIPVSLVGIMEVMMFNCRDDKKAQKFLIHFIEAIPVGVDLSKVYYKWAVRLLKRVRVHALNDIKVIIDNLIELLKKPYELEIDKFINVGNSVCNDRKDPYFNTIIDDTISHISYTTDSIVNKNDYDTKIVKGIFAIGRNAMFVHTKVASYGHSMNTAILKTNARNNEEKKQRDDLMELLKT